MASNQAACTDSADAGARRVLSSALDTPVLAWDGMGRIQRKTFDGLQRLLHRDHRSRRRGPAQRGPDLWRRPARRRLGQSQRPALAPAGRGRRDDLPGLQHPGPGPGHDAAVRAGSARAARLGRPGAAAARRLSDRPGLRRAAPAAQRADARRQRDRLALCAVGPAGRGDAAARHQHRCVRHRHRVQRQRPARTAVLRQPGDPDPEL